MQTELIPIFKLRDMCLARLNQRYYTKHADLIHRSALAAQDYVLSGTYASEYKSYMGRTFKQLPGYIAVHQKYNLPYDAKASTLSAQILHPGLVMDLAWAFATDITNGIVDKYGNIIAPNYLASSEVLAVYHNTSAYGVPVNALQLLNYQQKKHFLISAHTAPIYTK